VGKLLGYLSFAGRANRQRYWVRAFLQVALFIIGVMLTLGMSDIVPVLGVVFIPVLLVFVIAVLANSARRLHDRNKSAWWLLLFVVLPTLMSLPFRLVEAAHDDAVVAPAALLAVLSLPISIWGFVEFGCLKGTTGPNKYGDDPLQPAAEVFA
jgi:uncharacterized membrane protein YhaH (DUF805 family)